MEYTVYTIRNRQMGVLQLVVKTQKEGKKFDADGNPFFVYNKRGNLSCRMIRQNGGGEEYEVSNYWKYYAGGAGAV